MSESWDNYAESWDSNEDVVAYADKAFRSLLDMVDIQGMSVLDFGCGTGLLTERMSPLVNEVVALDSSEAMIAVLQNKKLSNVTTVAEELSDELIQDNPLFAEGFDLIVASSVCSFLPEFEKTLALLKSLLVTGGTFIQWDWLAKDGDSDFGFGLAEVENVYQATGLKLQTLKLAFSLNSDKGDMPVLMGMAKNV